MNVTIIPEPVELKLDQLEQKNNNIKILSCKGDFIDNLTYNDNNELKSNKNIKIVKTFL